MTLKFDINKVICINVKSLNEQQLFSISENFRINFEILVEIKKEDYCQKIWLQKSGDWVIAYTTKDRPDEIIVSYKFLPMTKKQRQQIENIKPIATPKMPTDDSCLNSYQYYLNKGYDIKTKFLDDKLKKLTNTTEFQPTSNKSDVEKNSIESKKLISDKTEAKPKSTKSTKIVLELDAILDKINESGMDSLTKEELLYLIKYK
jgi:Tfp pilus assembly protein PilZ